MSSLLREASRPVNTLVPKILPTTKITKDTKKSEELTNYLSGLPLTPAPSGTTPSFRISDDRILVIFVLFVCTS
jgi:hypothetical protein